MSRAPRISFPGNARSGLKFVAPPGPLASAPVASANDGLYFYDNVTSLLYLSSGGEWVTQLKNDDGEIINNEFNEPIWA